eukprot:13908397-Alexandrium_andersonii.AAC.1
MPLGPPLADERVDDGILDEPARRIELHEDLHVLRRVRLLDPAAFHISLQPLTLRQVLLHKGVEDGCFFWLRHLLHLEHERHEAVSVGRPFSVPALAARGVGVQLDRVLAGHDHVHIAAHVDRAIRDRAHHRQLTSRAKPELGHHHQ